MRVKSAIQRWPPESFCGLPNPHTPTLHLTAPTRKDQFHGGMSHCSQACSKAITQSNTKSPLHFLVFWKLLSTVVVRPFWCQGLFSKGRQASLCEKGVALHIVTAGEALLKATCQHNQPQQCQKRGRRKAQCVGGGLETVGHWRGSAQPTVSLGHRTTHCLEERGTDRESAWWCSLKGQERAITSQTNAAAASRATLGKLLSA